MCTCLAAIVKQNRPVEQSVVECMSRSFPRILRNLNEKHSSNKRSSSPQPEHSQTTLSVKMYLFNTKFQIAIYHETLRLNDVEVQLPGIQVETLPVTSSCKSIYVEVIRMNLDDRVYSK